MSPEWIGRIAARGPAAARRARWPGGVSLIEMLVVIAVLGLLLALALAATEWTLPSWRVRAATGAAAAELRAARQRAVTRRNAVSVDFDAGARQYAMIDDGGNIVRTTHLPPAVAFAHPDGNPTVTLRPPGTNDTAALFNPRGQLLSVNMPGHAYFGNEARGAFMRVQVNVVGAVTVEEWNGSTWQ